MELAADGLILRPPEDRDAVTVADAVQKSLPELIPWMPWASPGYDHGAALAWIRGETGDAYRFVMIDPAGELVGSCGLNGLSALNRSGNLGYWVRSDQTGNGYATTATRLLRRYGHDVAELHRIEVVMSVHNEASRRVAEKAGAHHEGRLRGCLRLHGEFHDAHCWSFVSD
jgi:RimJ/RimL family protein N-acetyltransferase